MSQKVAMWRIDAAPTRLQASKLPLESKLEDAINVDPSILAGDFLILGRQVPTVYGGFIDLLAIDEDGGLHVFELKRGRTPRDVVAQALDYGSWVQQLSYEDVQGLYSAHRPGNSLEVAFENRFGTPLPDELSAQVTMSIVAGSMDPSTERIVTFLSDRFQVPINVLFFEYFADGTSEYLVRTWLLEESERAAVSTATKSHSAQAPWNGRDWYVSFGDDESGEGRRWSDAVKYGFVAAGGGDWYSRTLRKLPEGARIFVYLPGRGYAGVGIVTRAAVPSGEASVSVDGEDHPLQSVELEGDYRFEAALSDAGDEREYVAAVRWDRTVPGQEAFKTPGLFSNQNSACKLRSQFTIEAVSRAFNLD